MESGINRSSDLESFITSIRECMPDTAPVREALGFARLVMEHPSPSGNLNLLRGALWGVATMHPGMYGSAAKHLRSLAGSIPALSDYSTTGQVLELALHTLALRFDDRATARMICIDLGMLLAGIQAVGIDDVIPVWESGRAPVAVMSPGPVRFWAADNVSRVCDSLLAQTLDFRDWSPADLENALLAMRMSYCVFRSPMVATKGGCDILEDFEINGIPVWVAIQRVLERRSCQEMPARRLSDGQWHVRAREAVKKAIGA